MKIVPLKIFHLLIKGFRAYGVCGNLIIINLMVAEGDYLGGAEEAVAF